MSKPKGCTTWCTKGEYLHAKDLFTAHSPTISTFFAHLSTLSPLWAQARKSTAAQERCRIAIESFRRAGKYAWVLAAAGQTLPPSVRLCNIPDRRIRALALVAAQAMWRAGADRAGETQSRFHHITQSRRPTVT